jgi:hypothetical protein
MLELPRPDHLPCPECGASVAREHADSHTCDEARRLDYLVIQYQDELAGFEDELGAWLESPEGMFAAWLAERRR